MKYVTQKDKYGCALACMAMIVGITYNEIKCMWPEKYGTNEGIADFMQVSFLFNHGYIGHTIYATEAHTQIKRADKQWIKPFAPIHIVSTITSNGPHAVVWHNNGDVDDPNNVRVKSIDDYKVVGITGYWKIR